MKTDEDAVFLVQVLIIFVSNAFLTMFMLNLCFNVSFSGYHNIVVFIGASQFVGV